MNLKSMLNGLHGDHALMTDVFLSMICVTIFFLCLRFKVAR